MPIDTDSAPGAELPEARSSWTADDVIVCHLGRGAAGPSELACVCECGFWVLRGGTAVLSGAAIGTTWSQG